MTNIGQEILDWYNDNDQDEKEDYLGSRVWSEFYENLTDQAGVDRGFTTPTLASGKAIEVEDFGGEGQGDVRYVVFKVGDKFYKVEGYYASWDGTTWDDPEPFEVEPVVVTVTKYRQV